ncbi:chaperonin 10-like protein [Talaromyces proteolyticus]|uniref:Chaperonin 10-like protein n=1 Tax=Talaromyces proteolyticus TaxID=1131652 RepID=A0AAD4Q1V8_9EURO|nr:chaperonin 10-like protein [Talaromyces proteolyticus]KAH8699104.1 chaperonin 10-like protein [Talaromyces proteolyticus]
MLEVIIHPGPRTELIESPIPIPNHDQVVIRVVVSGSNPKDWKRPEWLDVHINQGDDIAGFVHQVGKNVTEFKPGDRVAAFHEIMGPGGSYAEYALAWASTTFHIPQKTSFEEAATIPLAAMTAALGVFSRLELPDPWVPSRQETPVLIYGGATAVGAFALKFAIKANIHPLIAVAGGGATYVESLIDRSKGDTIIDYRKGADALVEEIQSILHKHKVNKLTHAFDAVCDHGSMKNILRLVDPDRAKVACVLPLADDQLPSPMPPNITLLQTNVRSVHGQPGALPGDTDFGFIYFRYFSKGLTEGWFSGHPHQVRENGLEGVESALRDLKEGKASAVKYVFRIEDTPALKKTSI